MFIKIVIMGLLAGCAITDDMDSEECINERKMSHGKMRTTRKCPEKIDFDWDAFDRDTWREVRDFKRKM